MNALFGLFGADAETSNEPRRLTMAGWQPEQEEPAAHGTAAEPEPDEPPPTGVTVDRALMLSQFVESLQKGVLLVKHGRQGDPHPRRILLDATGSVLSWVRPNGRAPKAAKKLGQGRFLVKDIVEVRSGWEIDPNPPEGSTRGALAGTSVLRRSCRWEDAPLAFSIIFPRRTLDLQCHSRLECKYLIHCFRELAKDAQSVDGGSSVSESLC